MTVRDDIEGDFKGVFASIVGVFPLRVGVFVSSVGVL